MDSSSVVPESHGSQVNYGSAKVTMRRCTWEDFVWSYKSEAWIARGIPRYWDNRDICQGVFPIEWSPPTRDMYVIGSKAKSFKASKPVGTQCLTSDIEVQDFVFALLDFGLYWVAISSPCSLSSIWEWECIFCPLCVGSLQFAFFFFSGYYS